MKLIAVLQGQARLMRNETLRTLEDGSLVTGFICEGYAALGATDISSYGGWRAYTQA